MDFRAGLQAHQSRRPWVVLQVYKRINITRTKEEYQLWGEFASEPDSKDLTDCLDKRGQLLDRLKGGRDAAMPMPAKPPKEGTGPGWKWW